MNRPAAIVFDMDGVLIDSEPLWRRAEIACFAEVGLGITDADCVQTQGLRIDEVVSWWFERRPWAGVSTEALAERIVDRVAALVASQGVPMPNSELAITAAREIGCRIALASSSPMRLIRAVLDRFGWQETFEVLRSAENEARGKPAPDVYLATLRALDLAPHQALAIEDSLNGLRSAKAAGLPCFAVPAPEARHEPGFGEADACFHDLGELAHALRSLGERSTGHPGDVCSDARAARHGKEESR